MKRRLAIFLGICLVVTACVPTQQQTRPIADGTQLWGYVGRGTNTPAAGETLTLRHGETKSVIDVVTSNWMGKYDFGYLPPGYYEIIIGKLTMPTMLKGQEVRLDIDLNNPTGAMDYVGAGLQQLAKDMEKGESGAGSAAPPPAGDKNLMSQVAGSYMSFSGGLYGSSTNWLHLCPGGTFSFSSESSYGGSSSDQYGNENMNWGSASQSASSGKWSIEGNRKKATLHLSYNNGKQSQMPFVDCSHESGGCVYINGRKYGWSAPNCK